MGIEVIEPQGLPVSRLPLSPAIKAGPFVFVSGQASVDKTGQIVADTFEGEMHRTMQNVQAVLAGAGLTLADVVQVRSYVAKQEDLAPYNRLYAEYFKSPYPARTTLIGCLGTVVKFEMDVVAWCGEK